MQALVCDRCKELLVENYKDEYLYAEFLINGVRYDLCPKCESAFKKWIAKTGKEETT